MIPSVFSRMPHQSCSQISGWRESWGRAHICQKYHKLYLWRKNCHVEKFWGNMGNFGRFCHNLRALSRGEKLSPKSTFVEKKWQIWGLSWGWSWRWAGWSSAWGRPGCCSGLWPPPIDGDHDHNHVDDHDHNMLMIMILSRVIVNLVAKQALLLAKSTAL